MLAYFILHTVECIVTFREWGTDRSEPVTANTGCSECIIKIICFSSYNNCIFTRNLVIVSSCGVFIKSTGLCSAAARRKTSLRYIYLLNCIYSNVYCRVIGYTASTIIPAELNTCFGKCACSICIAINKCSHSRVGN